MTDLAQIEQRLRYLEDSQAITALKYRYFISADRHDVPSVRDCFAPVGAVIEFEGFPRCESRDQLADMMLSFGGRTGFFTLHHGHNPQITFTGADSAQGVWALHFSSIDLNSRQVTQIAGEYHEDYVRQDGRWYIQTSVFRRQFFLAQGVDEQGNFKALALGREPDAPA
jgi:hypothetical protein